MHLHQRTLLSRSPLALHLAQLLTVLIPACFLVTDPEHALGGPVRLACSMGAMHQRPEVLLFQQAAMHGSNAPVLAILGLIVNGWARF